MFKAYNPDYTVDQFFEGDSNIVILRNPTRAISSRNPYWYTNTANEFMKRARVHRRARIVAELFFTLLVLALAILLIVFVCGISVKAYADSATMDTEEVYELLTDDYVEWSPELVCEIQTALNRYAKSCGFKKLSVDGVLGPDTDAAIKLFQRKKGLVVDGICGKNTLSALGIEDTGEHPRYAPNLLEAFDRTGNDLAAHLNLNSHFLEVYQLDEEGWHLIRVMSCATGSVKNGTMTKVRNKVLDGSGHSAITGKNGSREWAGDNAVAIGGGDFFHSVLRWRKSGGKWQRDDNSALGTFASHGCVRLDLEDSVWVKEHFTKGTALVIDNRSWDLSQYANGGYIAK